MSLSVQHISKSFGTKLAVDDLSLSMGRPGVFGLIGTNGAGKTTTIRMILGVADPDAGSITWNRGPLNRGTVRFGYMPEERGIYPKVSVIDQLIYFAELRGIGRVKAREAADYWLARLGVEEYRRLPAEKLSKGNQQKIQLIATVIHDPELIFLDEPFSGLDPINTDVFKSVVAELIAAEKFIVMSSHQMSTVEEYCHEILILDKGKTLLAGNLREIKAGYGNTNLSLRPPRAADGTPADILPLAEERGLILKEQTADGGYEFAIDSDQAARGLLTDLLAAGLFPERYEIRQPSLHEIFVEKVGATA